MINITPPEENYNFKFVLNNEEFKIRKFQFCRYSLRFQKDPSLLNSDSLLITSKVSKESLQAFIDACQDRPYLISSDNIFDLHLLCTEFEVNSILSEIERYFDSHEDELIIKRLIYTVDRQRLQDKQQSASDDDKNRQNDINTLAEKIASKLDLFIESDELFELSEDILCHIYSNKSLKITHERKLFDFAKKYTQKRGKETTKLLSYISFAALNGKEIKELASSKILPKLISTNHVLPFILNMIDQTNEQKSTIERLENEIRTLNDKLHENKETSDRDVKRLLESHNKGEESIQNVANSYEKLSNSISVLQNNCSDVNERIKSSANTATNLNAQISKFKKIAEKSFAQLNPFKGVFYDWKKCHDQQNPAVGGFVTIITPDIPNHNYQATNLLEYDPPLTDACYYLNQNLNEANDNNWVDFDFGENNKIEIFAISIRTNSFGETMAHPRDFSILGSDDREKWDQILVIENAVALNGARKAATFCCKEKSTAFRYLRYTQRDTHYMYNDRFGIIALSAIEFFGDVIAVSH